MDTCNISDQLAILGDISNYHWWQYIKCDGEISSSNIHVNLHDHLLYHPSCDFTEGNLRQKFIPKSPRNRIMYYLHADELYPEGIIGTIKQLLKIDNNELSALPNIDTAAHESCVQSSKRRKFSTRILKVTHEDLCNNMGVSLTQVNNSTDRNTKLYTTFREQLINDGEIMWRQHNENQDTFVMSDYNSTRGTLSPLSYVHVTHTQSQNDKYLVKCTCHIYQTIQCAALSGIVNLTEDEDAVLDESMTCMHCRFFKDKLSQYNIQNIDSQSSIGHKLKSSVHNVNNPIVVLGIPSQHGTTKLSVVSEESISMVHITFKQGGTCFANCQNGECNAKLLNKKKIPKSISIQQNTNLCGHIQTLFANFEVMENLFPMYFSACDVEELQEEERGYIPDSECNNVEDQPINTITQENVSITWQIDLSSKSFTKHASN